MTHQFHPFDKSKKMNWNIWTPGVTNMSHLDMATSICLMLEPKTGIIKMKKSEDVTVAEWNQMAGGDFVIAVSNESECF